jgi:hypothetical protein
MLLRPARAVLPLFAAALGAQSAAGGEPPAAVAAWLASDQVDEALLDKATAALLDREDGMALLGARLRPALATPAAKETKGLIALATRTVLGFLDRAQKSGMVFRGQYDPLQALQPYAGDLLFRLLLDSPDWFPHTHRSTLVPAIRDLQKGAPDAARLAAVLEIAGNVDLEPAVLRTALSCLLWQWGRKELLAARFDELRRASAEGDAEDRIGALRELARLQYEVADYERATATHAALVVLADHAHLRLQPSDWYWGACWFALKGDCDRGLQALDRCAELQAAADVDESHKLPRKLFESDPELARLRADPRFARVLERAFPEAAGGGKGR